MEGPPRRFQCPPEFEAVAGGVALSPGGAGTELWLIRAPADFCPQSLEGCPVPLNGLEHLRTPPGGGDNNGDIGDTKLYVLRGGPGGGDCPLLLSPVPPEGSLACAPPIRGSLIITQSFGTPPETPKTKRKKRKVTAELVALGDTVTPEGTVPPTGTEPGEGSGPPRDVLVATEEPEVAKRKKKKKKKHKEQE